MIVLIAAQASAHRGRCAKVLSCQRVIIKRSMVPLQKLFGRPSHGSRLPLELLILAVTGLVLAGRFAGNFWLHPPFLMDFNVYHFAAQLIATGQGHALYRAAYSPGVLYMYAPPWAVIWTPLALFSVHHAGVLWSLLGVGWLVATLWCANRLAEAAGLRAWPWASGLAVLLLSRMLLAEFGNGQADLWWGGLVAWFLVCEVRGQAHLAAASLALSMALKLPSALFVPYLALTGRWRSAGRAIGWFTFLVIIGAALAYPRNPAFLLVEWGRCLLATGPPSMFRIGDQSFAALLARLLTADGYGLNVLSLTRPTVLLITICLEMLLFFSIILPRQRSQRERQPKELRFAIDGALLMILMALASPSCWLATYSVLLVPFILAITLFVTGPSSIRRDPWALLLAGLTGLFSILTHSKFLRAMGLTSWRGETYVFLVLMIPPLMALSLFACLRRQRSRRLT